jgi:hypothetical protein
VSEHPTFYDFTFDGRTGHICYPALRFEITELSSRGEIERHLASLKEEEEPSDGGYVSVALKPGRLFSMPCLSRLLFLEQELRWLMVATPWQCAEVRQTLAAHVGGQFSDRAQHFDWGTIFTDVEDDFTTIVHRFSAPPVPDE